jgi:hypothetical protein
MRISILATTVMLLATGCPSDPPPPPKDGGADLRPDLATAMDLTVVAKVGCNGFIDCIANSTAADINAAVTECQPTAKNSAVITKFGNAYNCGFEQCTNLNNPDAGAGPCLLNAAKDMITNVNDAGCKACLDKTTRSFLQMMQCAPATDAVCVTCNALYTACFNDTP